MFSKPIALDEVYHEIVVRQLVHSDDGSDSKQIIDNGELHYHAKIATHVPASYSNADAQGDTVLPRINSSTKFMSESNLIQEFSSSAETPLSMDSPYQQPPTASMCDNFVPPLTGSSRYGPRPARIQQLLTPDTFKIGQVTPRRSNSVQTLSSSESSVDDAAERIFQKDCVKHNRQRNRSSSPYNSSSPKVSYVKLAKLTVPRFRNKSSNFDHQIAEENGGRNCRNSHFAGAAAAPLASALPSPPPAWTSDVSSSNAGTDKENSDGRWSSAASSDKENLGENGGGDNNMVVKFLEKLGMNAKCPRKSGKQKISHLSRTPAKKLSYDSYDDGWGSITNEIIPGSHEDRMRGQFGPSTNPKTIGQQEVKPAKKNIVILKKPDGSGDGANIPRNVEQFFASFR